MLFRTYARWNRVIKSGLLLAAVLLHVSRCFVVCPSTCEVLQCPGYRLHSGCAADDRLNIPSGILFNFALLAMRTDVRQALGVISGLERSVDERINIAVDGRNDGLLGSFKPFTQLKLSPTELSTVRCKVGRGFPSPDCGFDT